ncbi:hypothetical protein K456DRAFT_528022 [Colletotrichum gloeosporioides 23]|nr:hypothetical protein K456DRAFT_528022 [Colletotrichum gloeosporioides 23]
MRLRFAPARRPGCLMRSESPPPLAHCRTCSPPVNLVPAARLFPRQAGLARRQLSAPSPLGMTADKIRESGSGGVGMSKSWPWVQRLGGDGVPSNERLRCVIARPESGNQEIPPHNSDKPPLFPIAVLFPPCH